MFYQLSDLLPLLPTELLDGLGSQATKPLPKYNLYVDDASPNQTAIEIALPSTEYHEDDLEVFHDNGKLTVRTASDYKAPSYPSRKYYKKQIESNGKFSLSWNLKKSAEVEQCYYEDGILTIKIKFNEEFQSQNLNLLRSFASDEKEERRSLAA